MFPPLVVLQFSVIFLLVETNYDEIPA